MEEQVKQIILNMFRSGELRLHVGREAYGYGNREEYLQLVYNLYGPDREIIAQVECSDILKGAVK